MNEHKYELAKTKLCSQIPQVVLSLGKKKNDETSFRDEKKKKIVEKHNWKRTSTKSEE